MEIERVREREREGEMEMWRGEGKKKKKKEIFKPAGCRQRYRGTGKAKAEGRQASRPSFVPGPRPDIEMESFECE